MRVLFFVLPLVLGVHSEELDEILCYNTLYPNTVSWILKDVYDSSLGAVRNISALQNIDFQESNIADEILYQTWRGGYLQELIFEPIFDYFYAYIKEAYVEKNAKPNNEYPESWVEEIFFHHTKSLIDIRLRSNFTGSISDMIKFQAKHLEDRSSSLAKVAARTLEKLEERENNSEVESMPNELMESFIDSALEEVFKNKRYEWFQNMFVYDDWTEKMEFRLIDHLKKKALFQKAEGNPLNGGDDILSFLIKKSKGVPIQKDSPTS